jgi:CheY-like chemotaxis protein
MESIRKKQFSIAVILAVFINCGADAENFPEVAVKAEIIVRTISYVSWDDKTRSDNYRIGFLGSDLALYDYLDVLIENRKISGRGINLASIDSLEHLVDIDVLIASSFTSIPFSEIALKARRTNTLVISEEVDDQIYITDVIMPEIDGYQLASTVKRLYPMTKIQLVSGYSDEGARVDDQLSFNLLYKPYKPEVLLDRIRYLLDQDGLMVVADA